MMTRTLFIFTALTGMALGQTYQDGVLLRHATTGPAAKAAPAVVSQFPNPQLTNYASGIEWYQGEVWCGSAFNATIIRCDDTGNVKGSFNVPSSGVRGILHDGTWLYVTVWSAKTLYELDPITGALQQSWVMPFPTGHPNGIAIDPNGELIISDEEGKVHWFNRGTGSITKSLTLTPSAGSYEPRGLELIGNSLYAGHQSSPPRVAEYDIVTGVKISEFNSPPGVIYQQGVGSGEDSGQLTLWLTGGGNSTVQADCVQVGYFGPAPGNWTDLGFALPGTTTPVLKGIGDLSAGTQVTLDLTSALANTNSHLIVGLSQLGAPFFGGTLVPFPNIILYNIPTGAAGAITLSATMPPVVPSGVPIYVQYWIVDPLGPAGFSASNGITRTTP